MIKLKDVLVEILLGAIWMISAFFLLNTDYPILIIPLFILVIYIKVKVKNSKKIAPFVVENFRKLGFELLSERTPKFSETKFEFTIEPVINDIPLSRYKYKRRFCRVFLAKNKEGKKVELNSIITKKWNDEIVIEITNTRNVY